MKNIYLFIRVIFFTYITILLYSCSFSSYTERYGSDSNKNKSQKSEIVEDEINLPVKSVSSKESEFIISKLDNVIGNNNKKRDFLDEIISYLNTPYRYGGNSRSGIDCSAFTQNVFGNSLKVNIPRTAREQYKTWKIFNDKQELKFGDLIYFNTSDYYFPGHVGIYLDDNLFAHASSSRGVVVSSLENNYYSERFVGANRVKIKK